MDRIMLLELSKISKAFKIIKRKPGLTGILKDILAPEKLNLNVIKEIELKINENERIGLVGKNGSGKSTLIKILCGVLKPDSGIVKYKNDDIRSHLKSYKQNIGVFWGQRFQLSGEIALRESLELLKFIYRIDNIVYKKRLEYIVELFSLGDFLNRPLRELSLGQRVICEAAAVFIHFPKIVFLDEPTIGLDLEIKHRFFGSLNTICNNENVTLIITSHSVKDIQQLTDRLLVLEDGRIEVDCPTKDFTSKYVKSKKALVVFNDVETSYLKVEYLHLLKTSEKNKIEIEVPLEFSISDIINTVIEPDSIVDIKIEDEDFEDVLLKFYKFNKNLK